MSMDPNDTIEDSTNEDADVNEIKFKVPTLSGFRLKKKATTISNDLKPSIEDTTDEENTNESKSENESHSDNENPNIIKSEPFSPAEKLKQLQMASNFSYKEPEWGGVDVSGKYKLEVIKEGTKIEDLHLEGKSMFVFGRLQSCDHQMDHPSISRHHAMLQYRPASEGGDQTDTKSGWYLYDLDSTHGTWVNKNRIQPEVFVRLRVGYVIKFGGSTRLFIMDGPAEDCDPETEQSFTELMKLKQENKLAQKMKEMAEEEENERQNVTEAFHKRNEFCSWGMDDDATEENSEDENPFAESSLTDESLYLKDPKKSIKGFFEREGLDAPEYEFIDDNTSFGIGSRKSCRLELPIDSPNGKPVYAEVPMDGKRRDALVACALEACKMLDRLGLLRQSTHESKSKKRKKNWAENDYYDSDDDTFLDRTGDLEKKREKRMKKEMVSKSETHESLTAKLAEVVKEMTGIVDELAKDEEFIRKSKVDEEEDEDALDAFMKTIKLGGLGVRTKMTMKARLNELKHTRSKLESLVAIAKPFEVKISPNQSGEKTTKLFGKSKFSKLNLTKPREQTKKSDVEVIDVDEEEEDEIIELNVKSPSDHHKSPVINEESPSTPKQTEVNKITEKSPKELVTTEESLHQISKPPKKMKMEPEKSSKSSKKVFIAKKVGMAEPCGDDDLTWLPPEENTWLPPEENTWLPPEDQIGDGRTKLNEKFGY